MLQVDCRQLCRNVVTSYRHVSKYRLQYSHCYLHHDS